jgi:hypothetical protein
MRTLDAYEYSDAAYTHLCHKLLPVVLQRKQKTAAPPQPTLCSSAGQSDSRGQAEEELLFFTLLPFMLRLYIFCSTTIHTTQLLLYYYTYFSYLYANAIFCYTFATSCCKLLGSLCTPSLRSAPAFNSATATSAYVSIRQVVVVKGPVICPSFQLRHCDVSIRHTYTHARNMSFASMILRIRQHTSHVQHTHTHTHLRETCPLPP